MNFFTSHEYAEPILKRYKKQTLMVCVNKAEVAHRFFPVNVTFATVMVTGSFGVNRHLTPCMKQHHVAVFGSISFTLSLSVNVCVCVCVCVNYCTEWIVKQIKMRNKKVLLRENCKRRTARGITCPSVTCMEAGTPSSLGRGMGGTPSCGTPQKGHGTSCSIMRWRWGTLGKDMGPVEVL